MTEASTEALGDGYSQAQYSTGELADFYSLSEPKIVELLSASSSSATAHTVASSIWLWEAPKAMLPFINYIHKSSK